MKKEQGELETSKGVIVTDEKGIVLIIVLIAIVTLTLLAAAAHRNVVTDIAISLNHLGSVEAFQAADGGAQYGFNQLWQELQKLTPNTAGITPPNSQLVHGWGLLKGGARREAQLAPAQGGG